MECKECGRQLAKNGIKNGVQYYYCTHCQKSYSFNTHEPNHHIFEEYIARLLYLNCVKNKNEFTKTTWTINQIARLLDHHHRDIDKWAHNENLPEPSKNELVKYLENRENGFDILCVLGYRTSTEPSEKLNKIIHRKERPIISKNNICFHISESEYLQLVNMPITNRKEAVFVLGALLGCRTNEIIGVKYSDIDYEKQTIYFHRTITFGKEPEPSEMNFYITNRTYPLTQRMIAVIEWLKTDNNRNKEKLGENYNNSFYDFICVQENGTLFNSFTLNRRTQDIQDKVPIKTKFIVSWPSKDGMYNEKIRDFQFKWLRYSVKLMMIRAGVSKDDIKSIFGYKTALKSVYGYTQNKNQLDIMKNAYALLDKYIDKHIEI